MHLLGVGGLTLVADEGAAEVDLLRAHEHDLLAGERFLGDEGGKATEEMTPAVDDDEFLKHS